MEAIAVVHLNAPELVAHLGEALDDPNSDVVADALLALQGAGAEAVAAYRQKIAALANSGGDTKVAKSARAVLAAMPDHK